MSENPFRNLPSVARLLECSALVAARDRHPHAAVAAAVRDEVGTLRARLAASPTLDLDLERIADRVALRLDIDSRSRFHPVINATGILLHTNLGRAPLHEAAARAAYEAARSY